MASNFAEENSSALRSSLSRQNAGFTNDVRNTYRTKLKCICIYILYIYTQIPFVVPFDDSSRQHRVERDLIVENETEDCTVQVPSDIGSRQPQVGRNLVVGNGTRHNTTRGFVSVSGLPCPSSELGNLTVENGAGQHIIGQSFASSSALPHSFSEAVPEHDDISRQLLDVSPSIVGNGKKGLNTEEDYIGWMSDWLRESSPKAVTNQPGKTRKGKRDPEYYRERRRKQNAEQQERKSEMEILRNGNKEYKKDLENKNREADALRREVQLLKEYGAECRTMLKQQQKHIKYLTKRLENPSAQPDKNARLRGEITRLQGEVTRLASRRSHKASRRNHKASSLERSLDAETLW